MSGGTSDPRVGGPGGHCSGGTANPMTAVRTHGSTMSGSVFCSLYGVLFLVIFSQLTLETS